MSETNKKVTLMFWDCNASIDIENHEEMDSYTLSVTEYQVNEEKSSRDNARLEERSVTEVYLGEEEIQELIRSLQYLSHNKCDRKE
ncbi:hypothetical protein M948_18050 [Virgibacillus sp. CM-4]|uniref:hypothetical protein n=1 Tax=Virgibacillus sp. CM-4 TaxID=1354277 RepID=UPI0003887642|nr:hypothetical protein [Virgibacillus sp. CM-4]EQB35009.1 hypothetical protein M948_18050 [Virgibacillus sp. CM-4]